MPRRLGATGLAVGCKRLPNTDESSSTRHRGKVSHLRPMLVWCACVRCQCARVRCVCGVHLTMSKVVAAPSATPAAAAPASGNHRESAIIKSASAEPRASALRAEARRRLQSASRSCGCFGRCEAHRLQGLTECDHADSMHPLLTNSARQTWHERPSRGLQLLP